MNSRIGEITLTYIGDVNFRGGIWKRSGQISGGGVVRICAEYIHQSRILQMRMQRCIARRPSQRLDVQGT